MGEKKVTVMILKVDLHCEGCYKRVKKLLCKFPEIRDRVFDENSNTVMIKVICCDPEKIRYKLCHKGRGSIKSIEIKEPHDPKPPENPPAEPPKPTKATQPPPEAAPKPPEPAPNPPEQARKAPEPAPNPPKQAPKAPEPAPNPPQTAQELPKQAPKTPEPGPKPAEPEQRRVEPVPLFGSEPMPTCCEQCYGGRAGGPCDFGYGPRDFDYGPPPLYYEGYSAGRMGYNGYGPNRVCHPGRCAEFFSEENPTGCSVM